MDDSKLDQQQPQVPSNQPAVEPQTPEIPKAPEVAATPEPTPPQTPVTPESPAPKKSRKSLYTGLALLIIIVVIGVVVYRHNNNTTTTVATATKHDVPLMRVAIPYNDITTFYPTTTDDYQEIDENHQIFEGLTGFTGTSTNLKVVPLLAKSWTNPDSNTWLFALQHNVKFHDGNLMTSKQVVASIMQVLPTDFGQEFDASIKDVSAVDDYTVKITTTSPDSLLPSKLTYLNIFDTDDTAHPSSAVNGTGPYIVKPGTVPSDSLLDLVANPSYWRGHVYTREVKYLTVSNDADLVSGITANKYDIAGTLDLSDQTQISKANYTLTDIPVDAVSLLTLNTLKGPFSNLKVREAVGMALDPAALAKARNLQATPTSELVPSIIPGYDPALKTNVVNDAGAMQLLTAAGYPNGLSFKFTYYSPALDTFATELQKELKPIGVTVVLDPETSTDQLASIAEAGKTDAYFHSIGSDYLDASDVVDTLLDTPYYMNTQLDSLYAQSNQALNPTTRLHLLQQMVDFVYNDKPVLPLFSEIQTYAVSNALHLQLVYSAVGATPGADFARTYSTVNLTPTPAGK